MKRIACLVFFLSQWAVAGGPLNVAGVSYYQSGLSGTPITWANGRVIYYTDQGDLSTLLPMAAADQFIADAFERWTPIATAAVKADRGGVLDEDVNGINVALVNGVLSLPNDVQASSSKPLAIVYDADGKVTDALLGQGAGAPDMCSTNSLFAEPDKIGTDAHIAHALIIINGNCATTPAQLTILKYRLVRAIGHVLGLDYSQLNENVVYGTPGVDDFAGIPVMHPLALLCTEANCVPNADIPRMDDRAAISRLYPVTSVNVADFPAKTVFKDSTGRVYGAVRFPASGGMTGQGMQGVNVVARMVDPVAGQVSRSWAASSVSGFLFRGSAGNPLTGYTDALGRRLDRSGSDDVSLEGFFDLAGLEIPSGYSSVTYELSMEPVNALYTYSAAVGPYRTGQVTPSGSAAAVRVEVTRGGEVLQDITVQGGASERQDAYEPSSFASPAQIPAGGEWVASLSGYGDADYWTFPAKANRTFTLDVTALDANGAATDTKAQPVLGLWYWNALEDEAAMWESYFNSLITGTTRLQAEIARDGNYKLGAVDYRGDGRPDYRYRARLLYGDSLTPNRASVNGNTLVTINGLGFSSNLQIQVAGATVTPVSVTATQMTFRTPALQDATYSISIVDTVTGARSDMTHVLHVGSADARLLLLGGSNPQVPVGTQAPNPFRVQVVDGITGVPVSGATVNFTAPSTAAIVGCGQTTCPVVSDQSGVASVYVLIKAAGPSVIQATLPTGGSTAVTINGVAATLELTLDHPSIYIASGSSASLQVAATVVANGIAVPGRGVNFFLNSGTATIAPMSSTTDSRGVATTTVSVANLTREVNISACVAPENAPCRTLIIFTVATSSLSLQKVSGDQQVITVGQSFASVSVKVLDSGGNAVSGAAVEFHTDVYKAQNEAVRIVKGESVTWQQEEPVVLATSTVTKYTDASGVATLPIDASQNQPVQVMVLARAGNSTVMLSMSSSWDANGSVSATTTGSVLPGGQSAAEISEGPSGSSGTVISGEQKKSRQLRRRLPVWNRPQISDYFFR